MNLENDSPDRIASSAPKKSRIAVIVGSGFSSALTSGDSPILGNRPLPTLTAFSESLLEHMERLRISNASIPFAEGVLGGAIGAVSDNVSRPESERYDFEEMLSLLAIGSRLSHGSGSATLSRTLGADPEVLRCVLYCLADFLASSLSYDGRTRANRNFFYRVNDEARATAMKEGIWGLVDASETTFVSFNYDGIIEAFLDHWLGQDRGFRYLVELSHAIPLTMPEHVYSRRESRDFSRLPRVPIVLKPHGSIHFFQLREELRGLLSGPTTAAVHPRLDIGFNPATGQRDIPDIQFWEFADPVPLIIPPLLNKDSYFGDSYFRALLRLTVEAIEQAECVLVIGFSLPRSDLHVSAAFEAVNWADKKVGLVFQDGVNEKTAFRWRRVASRAASVSVLSENGLPAKSVGEIANFWRSIHEFLQGESRRL